MLATVFVISVGERMNPETGSGASIGGIGLVFYMGRTMAESRGQNGPRLRLTLSMRMRAARMRDYDQPLRIVEVPVPDIGPADVLVKVAATDRHMSHVHGDTSVARNHVTTASAISEVPA